MTTALKVEIISDMYSKLRISGLTVDPSPEQLELALSRLESMAAEFETRQMCVGYNFTDDPDPNDESGIPLAYENAFTGGLLLRIPDFNKQLSPTLMAEISASLSNLAARTFTVRPTQYPDRQPRGSGNTLRYNRWQRFYTATTRAPLDCDTVYLRLNEVEDYSQSWDQYLDVSETLDSYTVVVSSGLTISNEVLATPNITYRITATKVGLQTVSFEILTSDGRVDVRTISFEIAE